MTLQDGGLLVCLGLVDHVAGDLLPIDPGEAFVVHALGRDQCRDDLRRYQDVRRIQGAGAVRCGPVTVRVNTPQNWSPTVRSER